jgi:uncharacterized protein YcgI (DUF1989 family)
MNPELQREETPEFYRRRYEQLMARARETNAKRLPPALESNPSAIPKDDVSVEETIPGGWYWTGHVPRGRTLRIVNDHATLGVSALLWNADELSERYNPADTMKLQWTAQIGRGKILLSDMGRVLASITDDTCGAHDSIVGGSTLESNARNYGDEARRNTRDNFVLAASKHGLGPRDVGPCITFFAPVMTNKEGRFVSPFNLKRSPEAAALGHDRVAGLREERAGPLGIVVHAGPAEGVDPVPPVLRHLNYKEFFTSTNWMVGGLAMLSRH